VINHSLTENGKIDFYEVKFGEVIEIIKESDFIVTEMKLHEHEAKEL